MLIKVKLALLEKGVRQTRMAVDLGWDPSKLSRIVNELAIPSADDKKAIANYLAVPESSLFSGLPGRHVTAETRIGAEDAVH